MGSAREVLQYHPRRKASEATPAITWLAALAFGLEKYIMSENPEPHEHL